MQPSFTSNVTRRNWGWEFFPPENTGDGNRIILSQYDVKNVTVFQLKRERFFFILHSIKRQEKTESK